MLVRLLAVLGVLALVGCGSNETISLQEGETASVEFALNGGPDFANLSVLLCGHRDLEASSVYPCHNDLNGPADGECYCLTFNDEGAINPIKLDNLCPSNDAPAAWWTFTYEIREGTDCSGTAVTANLSCQEAELFPWDESPNYTHEELLPGWHQNQLICSTHNMAKSFVFAMCVETTQDYPAEGWREFDCGCPPELDENGDMTGRCHCPRCPPEDPDCDCVFYEVGGCWATRAEFDPPGHHNEEYYCEVHCPPEPAQ